MALFRSHGSLRTSVEENEVGQDEPTEERPRPALQQRGHPRCRSAHGWKTRRGKPFQARASRVHGCFTRVTRLFKVWFADGRGNRTEPPRLALSLTGQHRHAQGRGFWKAPLGRAVPEPHTAQRPSALAAPGVSDADAGGAAVGSPSGMPGPHEGTAPRTITPAPEKKSRAESPPTSTLPR